MRSSPPQIRGKAFSSLIRLEFYKEGQLKLCTLPRVEVGWNTSTVALRFVRDDRKRTQSEIGQ
jgi:hypothetical protein